MHALRLKIRGCSKFGRSEIPDATSSSFGVPGECLGIGNRLVKYAESKALTRESNTRAVYGTIIAPTGSTAFAALGSDAFCGGMGRVLSGLR